MNIFDEGYNYQEMRAEKMKFAAMVPISEQFLADAKFDIKQPMLSGEGYPMDMIVAQLTANVLAHMSGTEVEQTEQVPVSWWDMTKARFLPEKWQRGWFNVKYRTITTVVKHYHLCPHVKTPSNDVHFMYLAQERGTNRA